jgi:hypothetical protein
MRVRNVCIVALGVAAVAGLSKGRAYAGDQYQATIVADDTNTTDFTIAKPGSKIIIKPSSKPGDGGVLLQMVLKNVDCPAAGNDGGKANKCGSKGAADDAPTRKHVMDIGARALGLDAPESAGVTYRLEKGAAVFEASGKNTVTSTQAFDVLGAAIRGHALGIGVVKLHARGSDPDNKTTGCGVVPLPIGNTCIDGGVYGMAGINVPQ